MLKEMVLAKALCHSLQRGHLITPKSFYCPNIVSNVQRTAWYSTKKSVIKSEPNEKSKVQFATAKVVVQNTFTIGIITVGVAIFGITFYFLYNEMVSSKGPYVIYKKAAARCLEDTKVLDLLGAPIKVHGSGRRRKQHVNHMYYTKDGVSYMRLVFYLQGTRRRGTANVEVKENTSGEYEYSYLYVAVDNIGTIIVEDNRDSNKVQLDRLYDEPAV